MRSWSSFGSHGASRRDFLKTGMLGLAATAALGPAVQGQKKSVPLPVFEWEEATVQDLAKAFRSGRTDPSDLLRAYRKRIEVLDKPHVYSVIELTEMAQVIAGDRRMDLIGGRRDRGLLHGIPILIKDN